MSGGAPARVSAACTGGRRERAGAQCQLEDEYIKRIAVADDNAEWVHAVVMKKATLRAFVEPGSPFNSCLL